MTKVRITINSWTTNVHAYEWSMKRFEGLLGSREGIVDIKLIVHCFFNNGDNGINGINGDNGENIGTNIIM